jgi:hypothetical protein
VGAARSSGKGSEPSGSNDRRTNALARLGSVRGVARQATRHVGRAGRRTVCAAGMGRAWDAGRRSTRAHLGFAFGARRSGGCITGVRSNVGIAAAAGRLAGASAKLERTRTCFCAAPRPGTACRRAVVGRPRRAGTRMGRARSGGSTNRARRAGGAVMGSAPCTAGERAASPSTGGGRTVMGSAPGG